MTTTPVQHATTSCQISLLIVLYLAHPSIALQILEFYDCVDLGNSGSFLKSDMTVSCRGGEYAAFMVVNTLFLVVYVLGMPAAAPITRATHSL